VEYFREDNSYYIVSSKVSEKKLTAEQVSKLDRDAKLEIMRKYAEALKALADNDVVHGDIKHSNVFIVETPKGPQPRFIDFDDSYFSGEMQNYHVSDKELAEFIKSADALNV
jgi:serine/threonine protein kinase